MREALRTYIPTLPNDPLNRIDPTGLTDQSGVFAGSVTNRSGRTLYLTRDTDDAHVVIEALPDGRSTNPEVERSLLGVKLDWDFVYDPATGRITKVDPNDVTVDSGGQVTRTSTWIPTRDVRPANAREEGSFLRAYELALERSVCTMED